MDKSMMYVMNYMPNGTKGSHKQVEQRFIDVDGEFAYPLGKKGKLHLMDQLKYQQARQMGNAPLNGECRVENISLIIYNILHMYFYNSSY